MAKNKIRLYMQKVEGKPLRYGTHDQKRYDLFDAECSDGCYAVDIKKSVKHKSKNQLGAHFGLLIQNVIVQANDNGYDTSSFLKELVRDDLPNGVPLSKDFLKELFYALCPIYRDGKRITLSKASTAEASKHFEECRNLLAAHDIYIEEPNSNWKEK